MGTTANKIPALAPGEVYVGLVLTSNGTPDYHLTLFPETGAGYNWEEAMEWAAGQRLDLPTCAEWEMILTNCRKEIIMGAYWTNTEYNATHAWKSNGCMDCDNPGASGHYSTSKTITSVMVRAVNRIYVK